MKKALTKCPVCGERLKVVEYRCPSCRTVIRGSFEACEFCSLEEEHLEFLRLFLRSRGNLSLVAKELGVSHPTAKQKLNNLLAALGYESEDRTSTKEVLDMLESGEITSEEAVKLLKGGR